MTSSALIWFAVVNPADVIWLVCWGDAEVIRTQQPRGLWITAHLLPFSKDTCACVCVWVKERERERLQEKGLNIDNTKSDVFYTPWYELMGASVEVLMTSYQKQFLVICPYRWSPPPPDRHFYWEGWRTHTHIHTSTSTDGENLSELRIYTFLHNGGRISGTFPFIFWPSVCFPAGVGDKALPFLCWSSFSQEMRRKQESRNWLQISPQEIMF